MNKVNMVDYLISKYENFYDKNSSNYKGKEECKYYEKRVYIKNK